MGRGSLCISGASILQNAFVFCVCATHGDCYPVQIRKRCAIRVELLRTGMDADLVKPPWKFTRQKYAAARVHLGTHGGRAVFRP